MKDMYKSYRFKIEKHNEGIRFTVSDYQPIWLTLVEGAILLGGLAAAYIKLSPYFN
jgi:hypothetical protein